ncbi:MAG: DUF2326 domain-containing protein [Sulfurovum sp.]|nr:DUF2326 domain-containing protein [Sulfurovum sp.]
MFIKQLKIESKNGLVRNILFYKGANLILDYTEQENKTKSGNNVGKTTVLKLIDFCLGGKAKNIYTDPEFKTSNKEVETFLINQQVVITLILVDDLYDTREEINIQRNFLSRNEKIQQVNNENIRDDKKFQAKLKELIFKSTKEKPTFRQIIAKNIRDDENRIKNTLKVLHPTTTQEEYEALYLFWLGIDLDTNERKQKLLSLKKIEENLQKKLKKENNLPQIKQSLIVIDNAIKELELKKDTFSVNPNYKNEIEKLNQIKMNLNMLSTNLSRLELRKNLILESQNEVEKNSININTKKVKELYQSVRKLVPDLQKSFEDTLAFHNSMIKEKIRYITSELPEIEQQIKQLKSKIDENIQKEKNLSKSIIKSDLNQEYQEIITELTKLYEQKGTFLEQQRMWEDSIERLNKINQELEAINKGIENIDELIQERITKFNEFFSEISYKLYNERFILSSQKNDRGIELTIQSLSGRLGTGKKKGEIFGFDLAYIKFADELNIECLHFVLLDQIENVHDNQISNLLLEIIAQTNGQYILPVLKDKLPNDIDYTKYKILSLSQDDKLFKI